jgi:hypothetical protein
LQNQRKSQLRVLAYAGTYAAPKMTTFCHLNKCNWTAQSRKTKGHEKWQRVKRLQLIERPPDEV